MKKSLPIAASALALALLLSGARAQESSQGGEDLGKRVGALELALAAEQKAHAETRALLEQTVGYLHEQSAGAKKMMGVFQASEEAGFTAGINFRSREILLSGLRDYMTTLQKDVPGQKKAAGGGAAR